MKTRRARCLIGAAAPRPASRRAVARRRRDACATAVAQRRRPRARAEARQLARRRGADEAREIVLDVPAQVVDQPVDVGRERGVARDVDAAAARRRAPARSASAGLAASTRDAQVGAAGGARRRSHSSSPAGVMRNASGRQRAAAATASPRSSTCRLRPACGAGARSRPARPRDMVEHQQRQALDHGRSSVSEQRPGTCTRL